MARITNWKKITDRNAPDPTSQIKRTVLAYKNTATGEKVKLVAKSHGKTKFQRKRGTSLSYNIVGAPVRAGDYYKREKAEKELREWLKEYPHGMERR